MKVNPVYLLFGYLTAALILLTGFSLFGVRRIADVSQPEHDHLVPIYAGQPAIQEIHPQHDGVNVIYVYLKNTKLQNNDQFNFYLQEGPNILRQITINGKNITDGENVRFQFAPIPDSKGKSYHLVLTSTTPTIADAVSIGRSKKFQSYDYSVFYAPPGKSVLFSELISTVVSRFTLKLVFSWFGVGLISFFALKKAIIQV